MLPRTLFKYKAHNSKANGCLYHCFRQKGRLFGDRGDIWSRKRETGAGENERERMRRVRRGWRDRGGGEREGESERNKGRREGGGTIARFQLPFVGLSADVTSCSPTRRVPERGTSPPAPSSATFQVSIRWEGLEGWLRGGGPVEGCTRKRGNYGVTETEGANMPSFGHCPENRASDLPLI